MYCNYCGSTISPAAQCCEKCGRKQNIIDTSPRPIAQQMAAPKGKGKATVSVLIVVMLAIFVVVLVVLSPTTQSEKTDPGAVKSTKSGSSITQSEEEKRNEQNYAERIAQAPGYERDSRKQALALAFKSVLTQQGYEVMVHAGSDQLYFDCSTALDPRATCYEAYQASKHLPSKLKAELKAVGIQTLNFSPTGGFVPTWAIRVN